MSDLVDPGTWEDNQNLVDPNTPSFRFSRYFTETCDRATTKTAGEWLKVLDTDTINDFIQTFQALDAMGNDDNIDENHFTRKDMSDLLYLTLLIWNWETGKEWNVNLFDEEKHHLHVEYLWRFASLAHYEFLQRHGGKSKDERLERDQAQYQGRLAIFEENP